MHSLFKNKAKFLRPGSVGKLLLLSLMVFGWLLPNCDPSIHAQDGTKTQDPPAAPEQPAVRVPLIDKDPFDLLILDRINEFAKLEVLPIKQTAYALSLPIPEKPFNFEDLSTLKFQLVEFPEKTWQVPWVNITEIKLFEDMLMLEAEEYLAKGDLDLCFRTMLYLKDKTPLGESVELRQMFDRCLAEDGRRALSEGKFDHALAVYEELYSINPRFQSANKSALEIVTECYSNLVEAEIEKGDFLQAQNIVAIMNRKYGELMGESISNWNKRIDAAAIVQLGKVKEIVQQENADEAQTAVRNLVYVMPNLKEGHEMFREISKKFPTVYVGITQPATSFNPNLVHDWASRRLGRLTHRWMFEFMGLSDEGGKYLFPNGTISRIDDLGLRYRIEIREGKQPFGVPPLTTHEISNRLLELADENNPDYYIPWARLLRWVEIENDRSVVFEMTSPYVRPEALLQTSFMSSASERYNSPNGKYSLAEQRENENVFTLNDIYAPIPENQHPKIVERTFKSASLADEALIRGEIDVVDRIYPADFDRLRRDPMIEVRSYGIPTMHILIPNQRNLHMRDVSFRRGLTYAVNRESLVQQYILFGKEISGYQPVSGPFPPGSDKTEEIAYATNPAIRARPHSGQLAIVLAALVEEQEKARIKAEREEKKRQEMAGEIEPEDPPADNVDAVDESSAADGTATGNTGAQDAGTPGGEEKKEEEIVIERPTLVLAYPDNELVENLCKSMVSQWKLAGITVSLRKLPPGVTRPTDDDYDLLYMELFMQEPMVDAYQLFGNNGIVSNADATIKQALWMLDVADSWSDVAASLRRVHQQSYNGMTIIPLWQIIDHYAYRNHVTNVGNEVVHLYQNVERWNIEPEVPAPKEEQ